MESSTKVFIGLGITAVVGVTLYITRNKWIPLLGLKPKTNTGIGILPTENVANETITIQKPKKIGGGEIKFPRAKLNELKQKLVADKIYNSMFAGKKLKTSSFVIDVAIRELLKENPEYKAAYDKERADIMAENKM